MDASQRNWLVGLRRAWTNSGALVRWIETRGVSGVVWTPASYELEDVGSTLVSLVSSGARPDTSLLYDLASTDIRAGAEALAPVYNETEGRSGYVAVWVDAARLNDAPRAARELLREIRRPNVAAAMVWTPERAGVVQSMVAAGVPVALAGVRDASSRDAVATARTSGMDNLREDAAKLERPPESVPQVPVFLLGGEDAGEADGVFAVSLTTELALHSKVAQPARIPLSTDAEQAGARAAVEGLAARAKGQARGDDYRPPEFNAVVKREANDMTADDVLTDIWERDHTAWKEDPTEIADRLGWVDVPELMAQQLSEVDEFARKARSGGELERVVLCGMGGSSLAPQTFHSVAGGGIPLTVCDTTDPDFIASLESSLDLEKTMFVVASKSGTTVETRAHLEYFWSKSQRPDRFVAITDPGTELAQTARDRGFARCFENPPDIGGRFSGLSYFGIVPAALAGVDVASIVEGGRRAMSINSAGVSPPDSPAVRLAAALGASKLNGNRDKVTFILPPGFSAFGPWCEQLIAESTGKEGTGLLPVVGDELSAKDVYGPDRIFCVYTVGDQQLPPQLEAIESEHPVVQIAIPGAKAVGAEMYRWEMATSIVGYLLDINPFDQPDVEAAKQRTRDVLSGSVTRPDAGSVADLLAELEPPKYVALQAFITPSEDNERRLRGVATRLRDKFHVAVTTGFGPRFLHSTGQLHKGGPNTGVFVQLTGEHRTDVVIPTLDFTFGKLIDAQADGDLQALRDAGRPVARTTLDALEQLVGGVSTAE